MCVFCMHVCICTQRCRTLAHLRSHTICASVVLMCACHLCVPTFASAAACGQVRRLIWVGVRRRPPPPRDTSPLLLRKQVNEIYVCM
jgi:hypothetical protein